MNLERESQSQKSNVSWAFALGAGALILLVRSFIGKEQHKGKSKKRIFISFAIEDSEYRDYLVRQSRIKHSPFEFIDMSVKKKWDNIEWKAKCRTKIKKCDGFIALLSKNTQQAGGVRWEIKCAREENIPVIGMHIKKYDKGAIPHELIGKKVILWSWNGIANFIKNLK